MFASMSRKERRLWWSAATLSLLISVVSYRYIAGVGPVPDVIAGNAFRWPFLWLHVAGAATALLLVPLQLLPGVRNRYRNAHRVAGRIYAAGCLIGGGAGLVLALGASTGFVSTMGFGLLAISWIYTTAQGWRFAVQRRFDQHRAWMIRSFALTMSAVTLRLYLPVVEFLPIAPDDGYRAIAFLCWIPNFIVAEAYLRLEKGTRYQLTTVNVVKEPDKLSTRTSSERLSSTLDGLQPSQVHGEA